MFLVEGGVVVWLTVLSVCLGLEPVANGCPIQLSQGKPSVSQDIQGMSFEESKQCLLEATNHGLTQVVTDILDKYPNAIDAIDEVKRTSLIIASSKGDVDTVTVLLARNASID